MINSNTVDPIGPKRVKRRGVRFGPLAGIAFAGMILAGCAGGGGAAGSDDGTAAGEPTRGGTLVWGLAADPATLDPAICGTASFTRCSQIFGSLLRYEQDSGKFVGQMAESFETEDGKNWTLNLHDGATFSDGTPFDADAVVFNWDRIKNPETLSPAARATSGVTWNAVDPSTVAVTLESPNYQFPWQLVKGLGAIGSPTAIQQAGTEVGNTPVGGGPFVLDTWVRNSEMRLVRNDKYFDQNLPLLDGLTIRVINSEDQRMNALRSGEIDVAWSGQKSDADAAEAEGFDVQSVPIVGGSGLLFNYKDPVTKDEGLRQAMLHAYDSEQIVNAVFPGNPAVDAFLMPDNPARDDSLGTYPDLDLKEAQRLFDDYLRRTGKSSETVTLTTYAGIPQLEQASQLIQAQMQEIDGLTLKLEPVDIQSGMVQVRQGNFQTAISTSYSSDLDALYDVFASDGTLNNSGYSNPKVDAALEITRSSSDLDEVTKAYQVVNGEISKDGVLRLIQQSPGYLFSSKNVHGVEIAATPSGATAYLESAWISS